MIVAPLGSGSAGNSYFFESDGTRILIDAGFGPRETDKRLQSLGFRLEDVHAILITHEHYDHIRGAEKIGKKFGMPIYLTKGTLDASSIDTSAANIVVFENNSSFRVRDLEIHARRTIHDAADPACFVVEAVDGTRVGFASDLGHVDDAILRHLSGCDGLLFEANHDLDLLREGTYPWSLKRRIMSRFGHLSNDDSISALQRMLGPDLKNLCLIHLSEKNNHESIVRRMASDMLTRSGVQLELAIAGQRTPLGRLEISRRRRTRPQASGQMALF
jgi:phosphoribosyl 1,2-cyclic phosphodiesterase